MLTPHERKIGSLMAGLHAAGRRPEALAILQHEVLAFSGGMCFAGMDLNDVKYSQLTSGTLKIDDSITHYEGRMVNPLVLRGVWYQDATEDSEAFLTTRYGFRAPARKGKKSEFLRPATPADAREIYNAQIIAVSEEEWNQLSRIAFLDTPLAKRRASAGLAPGIILILASLLMMIFWGDTRSWSWIAAVLGMVLCILPSRDPRHIGEMFVSEAARALSVPVARLGRAGGYLLSGAAPTETTPTERAFAHLMNSSGRSDPPVLPTAVATLASDEPGGPSEVRLEIGETSADLPAQVRAAFEGLQSEIDILTRSGLSAVQDTWTLQEAPRWYREALSEAQRRHALGILNFNETYEQIERIRSTVRGAAQSNVRPSELTLYLRSLQDDELGLDAPASGRDDADAGTGETPIKTS